MSFDTEIERLKGINSEAIRKGFVEFKHREAVDTLILLTKANYQTFLEHCRDLAVGFKDMLILNKIAKVDVIIVGEDSIKYNSLWVTPDKKNIYFMNVGEDKGYGDKRSPLLISESEKDLKSLSIDNIHLYGNALNVRDVIKKEVLARSIK